MDCSYRCFGLFWCFVWFFCKVTQLDACAVMHPYLWTSKWFLQLQLGLLLLPPILGDWVTLQGRTFEGWSCCFLLHSLQISSYICIYKSIYVCIYFQIHMYIYICVAGALWHFFFQSWVRMWWMDIFFFSGVFLLGCRGQAKATRNREARLNESTMIWRWWFRRCFLFTLQSGGNDPSSRAYFSKGLIPPTGSKNDLMLVLFFLMT